MHWFLLGILVFVGIGIYIAKKRQEKIIVFASMLKKEGLNLDKIVQSSDLKNAIFIDTQKELWAYYNCQSGGSPILKYSDLLDFEIIEDGNSVLQSRSGSALLGGALFGSTGAIIGASRSRKLEATCNNLSVKIMLNCISSPVIFFTLLDKEVKKDTLSYKSAYREALQFEGLLRIILTHGEKPIAQSPSQESRKKDYELDASSEVIKKELEELKEMYDEGLITASDYEIARKKVLGIQNREDKR